MLFRHIIGYAPSLLVPAIAAFLAVFCYTRLLSPEEYGCYALALNSMNLLNAVFFYWLQVSLPRLMPQAIQRKQETAFRATAYAAYVSVSAFILVIGVPLIVFLPFGDLRMVAIAAIPLAISRSVLNLNQSFHRSYLDFNRYNLIECGQAILGLAAGLALVFFGNLGSLGANAGMVIGMVCMMSVDIKTMLSASRRDFDPAIFKEIARFGVPLVASFGLSFLITSSDRYFIEYFQGAAQVGVYAAGYALVDRIITMLFMAIATPSFPLVVQRLEQDGIEAARHQMQRNGLAVLFLVLPACAGLMMSNVQLVNTLIGLNFREGALRVIPWIIAASALNGFSTHYFSHVFHLAKKPRVLFWIQVPVVVLNLVMNVLLIPPLGYMGAAYAAVASYGLMLALNIWIGSKVFPFAFPYKELGQIMASVALMVAVLLLIPFSPSLWGLVAKVGLGCAAYMVGVWSFDLMGVREILASYLQKKVA